MIATIARELRNNERFLLATHVNPDGDAIGSLGALALVLEAMGKEVVAYCQDEVPGFLQFLPYADRIVTEIPGPDRFEVAVVLDCGELDRIGNAAEILGGGEALASLRTRGKSNRPFTLVRQLEADAAQRWQGVEEELLVKQQHRRNPLRNFSGYSRKLELGGSREHFHCHLNRYRLLSFCKHHGQSSDHSCGDGVAGSSARKSRRRGL